MKKGFLILVILALLMTMFGTVAIAEDEPTHLTALFVKHGLTKDIDSFEWLKEIEKEANVDVEWTQYVIGDEWNTIKAALFASGDIPDIIINGTVSTDYSVYDGLFQDMSDLIPQYGPNLTAMFEKHPECKIIVSEMDGSIYSTPKYQRVWPTAARGMYINKQWLDNLGLEIPTTLDELYTVLKAFKDNDANGNGDPNDEIPYDYQSRGTIYFAGSYGITLSGYGDYQRGFYSDGGEIKNLFMQDCFEDMMAYIAKLHVDGLVNPETLTQDYSQYQSLARGVDGVAKVGMTIGWESTDRFGLEVVDQYVPLPQMTLSKDNPYYTEDIRYQNDYEGLNYGANRCAMSAACENKEAAMRFIDTFYKPENSLQVLWGGITDGCISKDGENEYSILAPADSTIDAGTWKWMNAFADNGPTNIDESLNIHLGVDMLGVVTEQESYAAIQDRTPYEDIIHNVFFKYTSDQQTQRAFIGTALDNIIGPAYAKMITLQGDELKQAIEQFRNDLVAAGINEYAAMLQEAHTTFLDAMK